MRPRLLIAARLAGFPDSFPGIGPLVRLAGREGLPAHFPRPFSCREYHGGEPDGLPCESEARYHFLADRLHDGELADSLLSWGSPTYRCSFRTFLAASKSRAVTALIPVVGLH